MYLVGLSMANMKCCLKNPSMASLSTTNTAAYIRNTRRRE